MSKIILVSLYLSFFYLCCSCGSGNSNGGGTNPTPNLASLAIHLTDLPADYESVSIEIRNVEINMTNDENAGWQTLQNVKVGVYDLLKLANGLDTLLATDKIAAGTLQQIRLTLGENNLVGENGKLYPLIVPSGQSSGIKIKVNTTIIANKTYRLLIDFDASKSVVKQGNSNRYLLKPVVRGFLSTESSGISGKIAPNNVKTVLTAIIGTDSVSSYANTNGNFLLQGLQAGTYRLLIAPKKPYKEKFIQNIVVSANNITNLGAIDLQ